MTKLRDIGSYDFTPADPTWERRSHEVIGRILDDIDKKVLTGSAMSIIVLQLLANQPKDYIRIKKDRQWEEDSIRLSRIDKESSAAQSSETSNKKRRRIF